MNAGYDEGADFEFGLDLILDGLAEASGPDRELDPPVTP